MSTPRRERIEAERLMGEDSEHAPSVLARLYSRFADRWHAHNDDLELLLRMIPADAPYREYVQLLCDFDAPRAAAESAE